MPQPNPDLDFRSVYAKLNWAIQHFKTVDFEINAWLNNGHNRIDAERNEDGTQHFLRAIMPGPRPNFERWSLMIGDCLTNLRDCLDHAIYAIAQLPTSPRPDKRDKACFLITSRPEDFRDWGKSKLASIPDAVRDVMLSFQPFNRPHPVLPPLLAILAELANGNKHRILNVTMTSPGIANIEFVSHAGLNQPATIGIRNLDVQDGDIIFVFEVSQPDPSIQLKLANVGLHVAIKHTIRDGDTEFGADRTSYHWLIKAIMDEVAFILDALKTVA